MTRTSGPTTRQNRRHPSVTPPRKRSKMNRQSKTSASHPPPTSRKRKPEDNSCGECVDSKVSKRCHPKEARRALELRDNPERESGSSSEDASCSRASEAQHQAPPGSPQSSQSVQLVLGKPKSVRVREGRRTRKNEREAVRRKELNKGFDDLRRVLSSESTNRATILYEAMDLIASLQDSREALSTQNRSLRLKLALMEPIGSDSQTGEASANERLNHNPSTMISTPPTDSRSVSAMDFVPTGGGGVASLSALRHSGLPTSLQMSVGGHFGAATSAATTAVLDSASRSSRHTRVAAVPSAFPEPLFGSLAMAGGGIAGGVAPCTGMIVGKPGSSRFPVPRAVSAAFSRASRCADTKSDEENASRQNHAHVREPTAMVSAHAAAPISPPTETVAAKILARILGRNHSAAVPITGPVNSTGAGASESSFRNMMEANEAALTKHRVNGGHASTPAAAGAMASARGSSAFRKAPKAQQSGVHSAPATPTTAEGTSTAGYPNTNGDHEHASATANQQRRGRIDEGRAHAMPQHGDGGGGTNRMSCGGGDGSQVPPAVMVPTLDLHVLAAAVGSRTPTSPYESS